MKRRVDLGENSLPGLNPESLRLAPGPWADALRGKRVLLLTPNPDLTTNPTLICLLAGLVQNGAQADVLLPDPRQSWGGDYTFPPAHAELARCTFAAPEPVWNGGLAGVWEQVQQAVGPHNKLAAFWRCLRRRPLDRRLATGAYDLLIGVDPDGAIRAHAYAQQHGIPFLYVSFEIFYWDELDTEVKVAEKHKEYAASQAAAFVIVQDPWRGALFAGENGLPEEKLEYLPVAPCSFPAVERSDYLRRRHHISPEKTIVLHSGSFDAWTCAAELLESVPYWPEDFVLVVHTRYKPDPNDEYTQLLQAARSDRLVVDLEPLPTEEYERLVASADIGLVLYQSVTDPERWESHYLQKNLQVIGLSSGKLSYYLKCALPVISLAQDAFDELLTEYAFGENVPTLDDVPPALERVRDNLAYHRTEAERFFAERLAFDVHWPRLAKRLIEVMRR